MITIKHFAVILSSVVTIAAFSPEKSVAIKTAFPPTTVLFSSPPPKAKDATATATAALLPERFLVQNRFQVRSGREAAFEKRWADRESRLGTLPGFRFFCMLRRIEGGGGGIQDPNYVSCTVWKTVEDFTVWRKGDAFKEAHGGGTVKGVASMLMASARNTKGKPKAAFWQGILPVEVKGSPPTDGEGWRQVQADGIDTIPKEAFVAMNRFSVKNGMERSFENKFASRKSSLTDYDGFKGFLLLRRDGAKRPGDGGDPDDGFTHSTFSVWKNKESFDRWMADSKASEAPQKKDGGSSAPAIYNQPPVPTFYEAFLVLESADGV